MANVGEHCRREGPAIIRATDGHMQGVWMALLRARIYLQQHSLVFESFTRNAHGNHLHLEIGNGKYPKQFDNSDSFNMKHGCGIQSLVQPQCNLWDVIEDARDAVVGLFVEKYGVVAPMQISIMDPPMRYQGSLESTSVNSRPITSPSSSNLSFLCIPSYIRHIVIELLKNACASLYRLHGSDVDLAAAVRVNLGGGQHEVGLSVETKGILVLLDDDPLSVCVCVCVCVLTHTSTMP